MPLKAVIFDYIGTLVNCRNYTMNSSKQKLCNALIAEGFDIDKEMFLIAYDLSHEKYRKVRYEQLLEVTNAVWVAEALGNLGFEVTKGDSRIKAALNIFFQDFIDTLELRDGAKRLLHQTQKLGKVALISNFTFAPVIYKSLRKIGISEFFNAVVVSQQIGWRKPSSNIFDFTLKCLEIQPKEAVYIGDSPNEDIKGAKQAGLKTVFMPSQFNSLKDLKESKQEPDYIANDLTLLSQILDKIFSLNVDALV
jgi:HAD superfamily hydrolase (TIGR01509 family)